ncbi:CBM96 family carbohydrate-binding protein [Dyadobacter sediminis]|uniref:DNRLRE domain-containing protein n=1 Tax=Dyadobacter sediminis TaxID=1493691 RepID=A0A5R9KB96_9BACT|nr:malectin domain-containing carbohydrate-binding protein [Dyadobacter sediminis]TLU92076.1 DNRLRE domain-containing protein [Dyadobacter sediminis]GGB97635.1 hypothetical protein GCM10011325_26210 [Dyadobacter sediminis]
MKNTLRVKRFIKSLLALLVFAQASVYAQPAIQWDKTIGGPGIGVLFTSKQTADGGYILGGIGSSATGFDKTDPGFGGGDYWIVKVSATGVKEWDRAYGGTGNEYLYSVDLTADGGYILGGSSNSNKGGDKSEDYRGGVVEGVSNNDYWIVKIAADGTKEWDKTLGGSGIDDVQSIVQTSDGGYVIGGVSNSGIGVDKSQAQIGLYDFWVVKLAANGSKQWDKTLGRNDFEESCVVRQTADGGYVLGGTSFNRQSANNIDYLVIRLAPNGTPLWQKVFGGTGTEYLTSLEVTKDGGYIVGGYSDTNANGDKSEGSQQVPNSSGGFRDYWVLKLTQDGSKEWDRTLGGNNGSSFLHSLYQTSDEGYILGGYSEANAGRSKSEKSKGGNDFWAVKLDANGKKSWDKTIGGNANDQIRSVLQTADGGYFLAGFSYSNWSADKTENKKGEADFWVVKLAPENPTLPSTPIRINAGGPAFTTATKKLFIADKYYAGIDRISSIATGDIPNTTNDILYQSARCSPSFSYNIPVPNGEFSVYLHFAETYFGAPGKKGGKGSRQFHVNMEGVRKLTNYDIFAKAGRAMLATAEIFTVNVTDGMLNIDFLTGAADLPRVSAIEVLSSGLRTQTFTPEADAMVRGGSYQNQNFGSDPFMDVKNKDGELLRKSYLRFAIPGVQNIKSAKLRVYGHNHESSLAYMVDAGGVLDDTWTENGITFSNAPVEISDPQKARARVRGEWAYAELDVTEFVKTQAAGDQVVSFALKGASQKMVFHSKENPSGFVPQLVIVTDNTANQVTRLGSQSEEASESNTAASSVIYPNPAKDHIMLEVSAGHKSEVDLELTNVAGSRFQLQRPETENNSTRLKVGLPGQLPAGMYLLKVQSREFSEVLKVLVTE